MEKLKTKKYKQQSSPVVDSNPSRIADHSIPECYFKQFYRHWFVVKLIMSCAGEMMCVISCWFFVFTPDCCLRIFMCFARARARFTIKKWQIFFFCSARSSQDEVHSASVCVCVFLCWCCCFGHACSKLKSDTETEREK